MQVIDSWETAEDDSDEDQTLRDTSQDKKRGHPPRSKAARIKDHQAERALHALISGILAYLRAEACISHERRVGRRRIEEEADQRIAEYMLGFRTGVDPDTSAFQWLPGSDGGDILQDGGIPGVAMLNPETAEGFDAFKGFLMPVISRNFEKEGYFQFLEALLMELARDLKGREVKKLGSELVRLGNEMMSGEREAGGPSTTGRSQTNRMLKKMKRAE